jgi:hypothetical protein
MRASRAGIVACAALGLTLGLIACGGGGSTEGSDGASTTAPRTAASPDLRCGTELPRFVRSLDSLRDQLAAGLTYDRYLQSVERLQRAYRRIPVADEPAGCVVGVGVPAEKALNQNIEATNAWGDCLAESCDLTTVEPEIKRRWARASVLITDAQRGLNRGESG